MTEQISEQIKGFYLIIDDVSWLPRILPTGVRWIQLRLKDKSEAECRAQIRKAKQLCQSQVSQLIINDYWQMALEEGCDYIHLGQEDVQTADLAAIRAAGCRFGLSSHDQQELDFALACQPDYIALGPIYETILKKMRWAPQGIEKISLWKQQMGDIPLIAIGGLTPERGKLALAAGADSVCVVTDVLRAEDPTARIAEWQTICRD